MRIFYPCLCKLVGFFRKNDMVQCMCISGFYRLVFQRTVLYSQ